MAMRVTVTALAAAKKLPVEALYAIGLESERDRGVTIPYFDASGQKVAVKRRTALAAKDGSFWPRGLPLMAYGLWRLHGAQKIRKLILVEGESDCWVMWHHLRPCLGIPGAGAAIALTAEALDCIDDLYVVIEPDRGGETFREGIGRRLLDLGYNGQVYEIRMPSETKDPAALHCEDPDRFDERLDALIAAAVRMEPPRRAGTLPSVPPRPTAATADADKLGSLSPQAPRGDDHRNHDQLPPPNFGLRACPMVQTPETLGVCLDDVKGTSVEWLWPGRLPAGKLAILDGDPGLGKSSLTLDMAARISTGRPMPGELDAQRPPADVVLLSAEDGLADTVRPRLEAAGADLTRIFAMDAVPTGPGRPGRPPVFPDDVGWLHDLIVMKGVRFVIIDPLMAFLGLSVNAMNDQNVRQALFPLSRLAETTGAVILVVRHLNKNTQGSALYRGGGSIGIIGAARIGLLVSQDPDDSGGRLLAVTKSNLAAKPKTLRFRVTAEDGRPRLLWQGESDLAAEDLLQPEAPTDAPAFADAIEFLRVALGAGPVRVPELFEEAHGLGLTDITLRRAKAALGATAFARPTETGKEWYWSLQRAA
jgi:AAA domain